MKRPRLLLLPLCALASGCASSGLHAARVTTAAAAATPPLPRTATVEDYLRVRCNLDGSDAYFTWTGQVVALLPGERPRHLFDVVGFNVARCARATDGGWYQTSRELMLYVDAVTGRPLSRWTNRWSGREVTVMHVANSPVQASITAAPPLIRAGQEVSFVVDVPVAYPNPLAADPGLRAYSPAPLYQAIEMFGLTVPDDALGRAQPPVSLSWHRVGPFLPWMEMGDRPGVLVYSTAGGRVASFASLPRVLRDEVEARLPLFRAAPRCRLALPNETTWTYFARHIDAWRRGDRFPLPAPIVDEPCAAAPP